MFDRKARSPAAESQESESAPRKPEGRRATRERPSLEQVREAPKLSGAGAPLPGSVRERFEPRFGHSFAHVRVHTDERAQEAARTLQSKAYVIGRDMVFGSGQYAPHTSQGAKLIAHELTHVVQQDGASPASPIAQRVPAPPRGLTRDPSKLKINAPATSLDYIPLLVQGKNLSFSYTSSTTDLSSTWKLYDAQDTLVESNTEVGGGGYELTSDVVKSHVTAAGAKALGQWTLRYEKGDFYDEVVLNVTEGAGPGAMSDAETTETFFNIRELPGKDKKVLGALAGSAAPITVTNKAKVGDDVWYKLTLRAPIGKLPVGTEGWVISDGVNMTVPWDMFLRQLSDWESKNMGLTLDARITKLRQLCHKSDLPFDSIIGTPKGSEYLDKRAYSQGEWQFLKDSQAVRMPDDSKVDVYHLLVGLDVLPAARRVENQTYLKFDIGQNYSAATWSGDIGAGATDAFIGQDEDWEKGSIPAGASEADKRAIRLDHYYKTRAPEADLLGDVDAWGINEQRATPGMDTLQKLLVDYYGGTTTVAVNPGPLHITLTNKRKTAVERFLAHYGFKTTSPLKSQASPRATVVQQIDLFAHMWMRYRSLLQAATYSTADLRSWYVEPMADLFIDWLEGLAQANGANVP